MGSDIYDNDEGDNDYFDDDDNDDDSNNIYDDTNNNNDSDDDDNNNNDNDDDRTIKLSFRKASISSEIRSFSVETILSYQHFKNGFVQTLLEQPRRSGVAWLWLLIGQEMTRFYVTMPFLYIRCFQLHQHGEG